MRHWIQTFSGGPEDGFFDYENPGIFAWPLETIAHHLANINRYTGAGRRNYSVAEHSWRVALYAADLAKGLEADPLKAARAGLLHDATEAVLGDVNSPLKSMPFMQGYRELEARLHRDIEQIYALKMDDTLRQIVRAADIAALEFERVQLLGKSPMPWRSYTVSVDGVSLETLPPVESEAFKGELGMSAEEAEHLFLIAAKALGLK